MNRYCADFERWRRAWVRRELAKARGSVRQMAVANGMHRGAAYKLVAKVGLKMNDASVRSRPGERVARAWKIGAYLPRRRVGGRFA